MNKSKAIKMYKDLLEDNAKWVKLAKSDDCTPLHIINANISTAAIMIMFNMGVIQTMESKASNKNKSKKHMEIYESSMKNRHRSLYECKESLSKWMSSHEYNVNHRSEMEVCGSIFISSLPLPVPMFTDEVPGLDFIR